MSSIYALGCRYCGKKIDVSRVSGSRAKPGLTCASHQEIIDFLHAHEACTCDINLIFGDSVKHLELANMKPVMQRRTKD